MSPLSPSHHVFFSQVISNLLSTVELDDGMELRLVNHAFSDEVLRLYFVVGLRRASFAGLNNKIWARWCLQGCLATGAACAIYHKPALDSFRRALNLLQELPAYKRLQATLAVNSTTRFEDLGVSSNPVFNNRASAAISDAVIYHHGASRILTVLNSAQSPYDLARPNHLLSTRSPMFWTFAAACVIGDVSLVQEAAQALQNTPNLSRGRWVDCLSRCLYIPARQGHKDTVRLLLELGADVNFVGPQGDSEDSLPITLAAIHGKQHIVELLLQPRHGLRCTGWAYENAIVCAARFSKLSTRRQIVQLLLTHGHDLQLRLRNRLFQSACLVNDIAMAQSVLADGPVQMSDVSSQSGWGETALSLAASRGHLESVQLILYSDFIPADTDAEYNARWTALKVAVDVNSITVFKELLPHIKRGRLPEVFAMAAAIDGGFSVMEDLLSDIDLNTRFQGSTIGQSSLFQASVHLRPENIKFLLERGVRVKRRIRVSQYTYKRNPCAYDVIQGLLRLYNLPLLELSSYKAEEHRPSSSAVHE